MPLAASEKFSHPCAGLALPSQRVIRHWTERLSGIWLSPLAQPALLVRVWNFSVRAHYDSGRSGEVSVSYALLLSGVLVSSITGGRRRSSLDKIHVVGARPLRSPLQWDLLADDLQMDAHHVSLSGLNTCGRRWHCSLSLGHLGIRHRISGRSGH